MNSSAIENDVMYQYKSLRGHIDCSVNPSLAKTYPPVHRNKCFQRTHSHPTETRRTLFPLDEDYDSDLGHMSLLGSDSESEIVLNNTLSDYEDTCISTPGKSTIGDYEIMADIGGAILNTSLTSELRCSPNAVSTPYNSKIDPSKLLLLPELSPTHPLLTSPIISAPKILTGSGDSPSEKLKTPHDTSGSSTSVPKLTRKSFLDVTMNSTEAGKRKSSSPLASPPHKSQKMETSLNKSSKARTALFKESEMSVNKLYGSDMETSRRNLPSKPKAKSVYLCNRKSRFGGINAGVRHKIRKPKKNQISKTMLLTASKAWTEASSFSAFINSFGKMSKPDSVVSSEMEDDIVVEVKQSNKQQISPTPDPNKKFFKYGNSRAGLTINRMKLKVNHGKLSVMDKKPPAIRRKQNKIILDTSDLNDYFLEKELPPSTAINGIINTLEEKENELPTEALPKIVLKAHNSVLASENSILLHASPAQKAVGEPQSNELAILLSPTSQMCDMTSGLALSSPKKAKQNITQVLEKLGSNGATVAPKLFPVFHTTDNTPPKPAKVPKPMQPAKKWKGLAENQMLLDAGQKKFCHTQCPECKIIYHMGDPSEELMHLNYHNAGNTLRFNGWKDENVLARFENGRIIRVSQSDPKTWWKKVNELLYVVNRDLGYYEGKLAFESTQVYLYIKSRQIVGCLVAEPKTLGYKMLPRIPGSEIDMCSELSYPIKCGISRIWVSKEHRQQGIGTCLLNSLRTSFIFGLVLAKNEIAFSSPTEMGKIFAIKYFETDRFMIYL